jgi:Flp pilus assembly protein TadG
MHTCRRRGIAGVWFAIMGSALALMLILAVDQAHLGRATRELYNTADASALAGALFVRQDQNMARMKAQEIAGLSDVFHSPITLNLNEANDPTGDIVLGIWDRETRTFTPDATSPNAVEVNARRDDEHGNALPMFLTGGLQFTHSQIARRAIAMSAGGTGPCFHVLCETCECAFRMNGDVDLVLNACTGEGDPECNDPSCENYGCEMAAEDDPGIQVDSDHDCATCIQGTAVHIEAPALNIVGEDPGLCVTGDPDLDIPEVNTDVPPVSDPLADIPEPEVPLPDLGSIRNENGYFPPGYYSGGIRQNSTTLNLCLGPEAFVCPPPPDFVPDFSTNEPAIYYLEGDGLTINGGSLYAYQVMFFVKEGPVKLNGNGAQVIHPADLDAGGLYGGISVFQARDNTTGAVMTGNNLMDLQGTYYFPVANLELGGTGFAVGNQVIAYTAWIHGTGEKTLYCDGRNPAPGTLVFLVF